MKSFKTSHVLTQLPTQFFASLVQKVNKVMNEGHDVINLGQGNPDQPTPEHIVQALQEAGASRLQSETKASLKQLTCCRIICM